MPAILIARTENCPLLSYQHFSYKQVKVKVKVNSLRVMNANHRKCSANSRKYFLRQFTDNSR